MLIDVESLLPLETVRAHTKTDDVEHVSDKILSLYREAALEACEQYTGRNWLGTRIVEQGIGSNRLTRRATVRVRLKLPVVDGVITLLAQHRNRIIKVAPGATTVEVPLLQTALDTAVCCGGCDDGFNHGLSIRYLAGVRCASEVPAGVKIGALKYIAWLIENPGDRLVTMLDGQNVRGNGIAGTNDGVWASGALESWRPHRADIAQ